MIETQNFMNLFQIYYNLCVQNDKFISCVVFELLAIIGGG